MPRVVQIPVTAEFATVLPHGMSSLLEKRLTGNYKTRCRYISVTLSDAAFEALLEEAKRRNWGTIVTARHLLMDQIAREARKLL